MIMNDIIKNLKLKISSENKNLLLVVSLLDVKIGIIIVMFSGVFTTYNDRNELILIKDSHVFVKRSEVRQQITWDCANRSKSKCKAWAITDGNGNKAQFKYKHNHKPDFGKR